MAIRKEKQKARIKVGACGSGKISMIHIIRSEERHQEEWGWLSTHWHFSFDTYYDPANTHWGPLRVFNDDVIAPGAGFPSHGHRDMEIVSYVIEGALEHRDSQGNQGVITAGEVQVMSAGSGIVHSEYNGSAEQPAHFLQFWMMPRTRGLPPRWEQRRFTHSDRAGKLLPVVSSGDVPGTLAIDQDAVVYLAGLRAGEQVRRPWLAQRKAYVFVISGALRLNGDQLGPGDQARMANERTLHLETQMDAELILLDLG